MTRLAPKLGKVAAQDREVHSVFKTTAKVMCGRSPPRLLVQSPLKGDMK